MTSKKLVLVTGASGFVGAQVVEHLLNAGYAVRGTSRSGKADQLRKSYTTPDFEVAVVEDVSTGDFTEALKGVSSIVHVASPLPAAGIDIVGLSVEGTTNLLRQAHAVKIYQVVIMSSILAAVPNFPKRLFINLDPVTAEEWNTTTAEDARKPGTHPLVTYCAAKALAERAAWEFAESHPEMDLTTLLPPYIFGPLAPGQVVVPGKLKETLSTNRWIHELLSGPEGSYPQSGAPHFVDVRDVARASVVALAAQPAPAGKRKRVILNGGLLYWKQAVRYLAEVKPELKGRLLNGGEPVVEENPPVADLDHQNSKEFLGFSEEIGWQKCITDTVDYILKVESSWAN